MVKLPRNNDYFNLRSTLDKALSAFAARLPEEMAGNSGVYLDQGKSCFVISFLGRRYRIHYPDGQVEALDADGCVQKASIYISILLLHYLAQATGKPLSGRWISFKELPGGQIYSAPYYNRTIRPLLKQFGDAPQMLLAAAKALGGKAESFGDLSVSLTPLPRVPLCFVLWQGDDEFPASGTILYDAHAADYLPTEDCVHLPGMVLQEMGRLSLRHD